MTRSSAVYALFFGAVLFWCGYAANATHAQRFPYEAPRAPEFDRHGNYVEPSNQEPPRAVSEIDNPPEPPQARWERPEPQSNRRRRVQPSPKPAIAPSRTAVAPQPPRPPDCSQFPMMIATAQSRDQMRWIARQYLTCLLQRGWRMEQARQEVIRVIEGLRARAR